MANASDALAMARPPRWSGGSSGRSGGSSGRSGGSFGRSGGSFGRSGGRSGGRVNCFLPETRILTPSGEVPVARLTEGAAVMTRSGEGKVMALVCRRVAREENGSWHPAMLPVRIAKGALPDRTPHRDLYVSQWHMLLIDGVLVPAGFLVNGDTIKVVAPEATDTLEYYHIDLGSHDVIFAEGAACETFVEDYACSCAPVAAFFGIRTQIASRLRSAISPLVDFRTRADVIRDEIETRAAFNRAA